MLLGCAVNGDTLEVRITEGNLVWGLFETASSTFDELAGHIRGVVLTPEQRADEERAQRKIESQHEAFKKRFED